MIKKICLWHIFVMLLNITSLPLYSGDIYSLWAGVSHTEGKGIGYSRGYTTLEAFFMPSKFTCHSFYPFLNIRGHGFDNLKLALNAGIGLRYVSKHSWIYGCNLFYDNRQGSHRGFDQVGNPFQQMGVGLEALGPCWDFRLNLYLPFGKKVWHFSQTTFNDNLGITPIIKHKKQSTMRGADAEWGANLRQCKWGQYLEVKTYFAIGPYYLDQEKGSGRWGGKGRFTSYINEYFFLEIRGSYDHVTNAIMQGRVGVNIPFYPLSSVKSQSCHYDHCFYDKISQPVQRVDIMPLHTTR